MKKISLILAMILCPAFLWAQVSNPSIISVSSAPSGSCSAGLPNQQVVSTGTQYSCQNVISGVGTWGAIGDGSGGSPAGASGNPQINAAGSFGADTNVFAAQAGDTISSIETECSAACTYTVNIPQTFTVTASHTLSSNVHVVFGGHGSWTVNGSGFTLTIPTQVESEALTQHFVTGTGSVSLGSVNTLVPIEWFGAVGDWNGTTGTDNTAAIQACVSALTAGQCQGQGLPYAINGTINFGSGIGFAGMKYGYYTYGHPTRIVNESATANTFSVIGPNSSTPYTWNKFTDVSLERSVLPSGTATGLYISYVGGLTVSHVTSQDSMIGFYFHWAPGFGMGVIEHSEAQWGYAGLTETTGTYKGFFVDSGDGEPNPSIKFSYDAAGTNGLSGITSYGMDVEGTQINDIDIDHFETALVTQGLRFVSTGGGGNSDSDIHITDATNDGFYGSAMYFSGLSASRGASVTVSGGWADSINLTGSTAAFDIESSSGIGIYNVQIGMMTGGNLHDGIDAESSSNLILSGNHFQEASQNYIYLNNTNNSTLSANQIAATSGANGIDVEGSSNGNTMTGNTITGTLTNWGIFTGTSTSTSTIVGNSAQGTFTLGSIAANGAGNVTFNPSPNGFRSVIDTSTDTNVDNIAYLAKGLRNIWGWKDDTPTEAWGLGYIVPGPSHTAGNNPIFAYYNGSAWAEAWDINSANGVLDAVNGINVKSYTVSTLPAASSLTAGTMVEVSDASSYTPGTCTGGGSDYMIAITNGTAWSCH